MTTGAPTILIIEDEAGVADNLIYALSTEGLNPLWCSTQTEGLAQLEAQPNIALIILDISLPDGNGFDLCRTIRKTRETPILFLTARSEEIDRILGLELGGDDYVVKPFSPREVTARVKAILRRIPAQNKTATSHSTPSSLFKINPERIEIHYCDRLLSLTQYEYRILAVLIKQPGRVFTRENLMTQAWDEPEMSMDRTVDAHIKTIRSKLRAINSEHEPIKTHRGFGYSLQAARQ